MTKIDPHVDGCPPEVLARQAEQYGRLFRLFRQYDDVILRLSFWNLHDGQSWLNKFPWARVNHPLLFDRQGKPKPAFTAVLKQLTVPRPPVPASEAGPLRPGASRREVALRQLDPKRDAEEQVEREVHGQGQAEV
jgi:hypothetical protein